MPIKMFAEDQGLAQLLDNRKPTSFPLEEQAHAAGALEPIPELPQSRPPELGPGAASALGGALQQADPSQFDFAVVAEEAESGDESLRLFENLEDARRAFRELQKTDGIRSAELVDQRSGNVLDEFTREDDGFPFLGVLAGVGIGVVGLLLVRRWLESRKGSDE